MMINKKIKKLIYCIFAIVICNIFLLSCTNKDSDILYTDISMLNGRPMGCMSGSIFDINIAKNFPDSDIKYFESRAELLLGLKSRRIDAYLSDKPVAMLFKSENDDITYLDENIGTVDYGICFAKKANIILYQFNNFIKEKKADGSIKKLQDKWIRKEGIYEKVDDYDLSGENGILHAITTTDAAPFSFFTGESYQGYEVELLYAFCERYGYDLKIVNTTFDALISSIASDKYDIAFNGIYITDDRKKSVDFSDVIYSADIVPVVRSGISNNIKNPITSIRNGIKKTFVDENRWKLIISGMLVTLEITLLSLISGTIIGFLIFFFARKINIIKKLGNLISYIISGLPEVLFLMILFYIIFSKSMLSGIAISIIGFTIIESFAIYDMLKVGTTAISKGQYEGALALGYTDTKAFNRIILPQAIKIIFEPYRKELVRLIKSTAIVGYVTVQDLTSISDIIRSRTYDAFFPLIVTALIYFILAYILSKIVNIIFDRLFRV